MTMISDSEMERFKSKKQQRKVPQETYFNTMWTSYLSNQREVNGFYELKKAQNTKGNQKIFFRQFEHQQLDWLVHIYNYGIVWKLSDADPRLKPCDGFSLPATNAYVVIVFFSPDTKYKWTFFCVQIMVFMDEISNTEKNYFTYNEIESMSFKKVII